MKFIGDESTGNAVANELQRQGHDVLSIQLQAPGAVDNEILNKAVFEDRILITNDKDFGELVYRSGMPHAGVILFRLHNERATNRVRMIKHVLQNYRKKLKNNFVVVSEGHVRIRRRQHK